MIVDLTDSITLIIIGACVAVGLLASVGLLGIAALAYTAVAAVRRLTGCWRAQEADGPNSTPHPATNAHTGTQGPARTSADPHAPEAPR